MQDSLVTCAYFDKDEMGCPFKNGKMRNRYEQSGTIHGPLRSNKTLRVVRPETLEGILSDGAKRHSVLCDQSGLLAMQVVWKAG